MRIIAGVSGGADSICMLHKLARGELEDWRGCEVVAAHFDHRLRANSGADALFVRETCDKLGVECRVRSEDVQAYAHEHKISTETAGRLLRYEFFVEIARENGGIIATAHNANDSAESVIMHLLRGSGRAGLCGIRSRELAGTRVVRPIIDMPRAEIEEYCRENSIEYLRDETNDDTQFFRNKVRHEIMPIIYENAGLEALGRASGILREEEDFLRAEVARLMCENVREGEFSANWFNSLHKAIKRRVLQMLIKPSTERTIQLERVDACIEMIAKNYGGKIIEMPDGFRVSLRKGMVRVDNCDR
ncbi:MAG: tRNA lysidine(34) synthetase TilS [Clostridiales bacterium]|jgi:tRNA(Ile)-lysidine synthase|nr:tRNA lysidine(34) synthetase TilS [Clostridiales bacterium]